MASINCPYKINFCGTEMSFPDYTFNPDFLSYEFANCISQLPQIKTIILGASDMRITETITSPFRDDYVGMFNGKPMPKLEQLNLMQIADKMKTHMMKHPMYKHGLYFIEVFSSKTNLTDVTRVITITKLGDIKIHINQN